MTYVKYMNSVNVAIIPLEIDDHKKTFGKELWEVDYTPILAIA